MWEFSIYINKKYLNYLNQIKNSILSSKHYLGGIFAISTVDETAILSIAIECPSKQLKNEIKQAIAECLVYTQKEKYISAKINCLNCEFITPLIKVLVLLDIAKDIHETSKSINLNDCKIHIESFFNFKLQHIKKKWEDSVSFIIKNKNINSEELLDVLKLIVESNSANCVAKILYTNNRYILEYQNGSKVLAEDEIDIISNLIISSPQKIEITCKEVLSCDTIILLKYLFLNKLVIFN
ncbi:MAG: hypothetical protein IJA61_03285 [Clostridia bacterium]|nr:hypothetical protein [Clostridia bacterium]